MTWMPLPFYGRSVDDLDAVALYNDAGSAGSLEQRLVNLVRKVRR